MHTYRYIIDIDRDIFPYKGGYLCASGGDGVIKQCRGGAQLAAE
jgi:hypothetical protein